MRAPAAKARPLPRASELVSLSIASVPRVWGRRDSALKVSTGNPPEPTSTTTRPSIRSSHRKSSPLFLLEMRVPSKSVQAGFSKPGRPCDMTSAPPPPGRVPEKALKDQARSWQRERRRVLSDPAPEAVHRLRTATRRLETGATITADRLGLASPVPWSDWDALRVKLSRLRNLDVTCELLQETQAGAGPEQKALGRRIQDLSHDRRRVRRWAVAALRRRRARRIPRALEHPATRPAAPTDLLATARAWWAVVAGRLAAEPTWRSPLAEALRLTSGRKEVHEIRIRVRELRYGLEWWNRLGLVAAAPVVAFLRDTQDTLGRIRDYHRAVEALSGPELRRSRASVAALRAAEIARWPSVAAQSDLLGSSPLEWNQP